MAIAVGIRVNIQGLNQLGKTVCTNPHHRLKNPLQLYRRALQPARCDHLDAGQNSLGVPKTDNKRAP